MQMNSQPCLMLYCYAADDLRADAPTPTTASRSLSETLLISPGSSSEGADIYTDPSDDLASPICRSLLFWASLRAD